MTTPAGVLAMRAIKPAIAVLLLWTLLTAITFWGTPQTTVLDAVALAYNNHPLLGVLLGLSLVAGAVNLLLAVSPPLRRAVSRLLSPLGAPWRRMPKYVQHQWVTLLRFAAVIAVVFIVMAVLRTGSAWEMLNAGIAQFPLQLPQYLIGGAIQLVMFVASFLLLFLVLSRGGVTTMLPEDIKTSLDQVWGQDQVVDRMRETILFLKDPERIEKAGGHVPGGVLLWGPPGTGKTLIAEAVAGETTVPFVLVEPGAFQNMFVGIGVLRVKALYRKLRRLADVYGGVVVFFDEADVLGSRGGHAAGRQEPAEGAVTQDKAVMPMLGGADLGTLNAILAAMQGVSTPKGLLNRLRRAFGFPAARPPKHRILHIMATNLPGALDPALLRPGRIDRMFRVGYPSKEGRIQTLRGYLARVPNNLTTQQVEDIAAITPHATGAIIKDLVNEALIDAIRDGRDVVTYSDMLNAKRYKEFGPPEGVEYVPFERHAVAIHESCHALMAWKLRKHLTIDTVTIEKGQTYLGMVSSVPNEDLHTRWKSEYEVDILVSLASLAGERMLFGDSTSGVAGDLDSATRLAKAMIGRWGMGGTIAVADPVSDADSTHLSAAVEALLEESLDRATSILEQNRDRLLALAHALEVHRTLTGKDVEAVLELRHGMEVDGTQYDTPHARELLEQYHAQMLRCRDSAVEDAPDPVDLFRPPVDQHPQEAAWPGETPTGPEGTT